MSKAVPFSRNLMATIFCLSFITAASVRHSLHMSLYFRYSHPQPTYHPGGILSVEYFGGSSFQAAFIGSRSLIFGEMCR